MNYYYFCYLSDHIYKNLYTNAFLSWSAGMLSEKSIQ
jgi:hypothetical protein